MKISLKPEFFGFKSLSAAPFPLPVQDKPVYLLTPCETEAVKYFAEQGADYGYRVQIRRIAAVVPVAQVDFNASFNDLTVSVETLQYIQPTTDEQLLELKAYYSRQCRIRQLIWATGLLGYVTCAVIGYLSSADPTGLILIVLLGCMFYAAFIGILLDNYLPIPKHYQPTRAWMRQQYPKLAARVLFNKIVIWNDA